MSLALSKRHAQNDHFCAKLVIICFLFPDPKHSLNYLMIINCTDPFQSSPVQFSSVQFSSAFFFNHHVQSSVQPQGTNDVKRQKHRARQFKEPSVTTVPNRSVAQAAASAVPPPQVRSAQVNHQDLWQLSKRAHAQRVGSQGDQPYV